MGAQKSQHVLSQLGNAPSLDTASILVIEDLELQKQNPERVFHSGPACKPVQLQVDYR